MCQTLYIGSNEICSVGELKAEVGEDAIVYIGDTEKADSPDSDDYCLCGVDFAETAWNHGGRVYSDHCRNWFYRFGTAPDPTDGLHLVERRPSQVARK